MLIYFLVGYLWREGEKWVGKCERVCVVCMCYSDLAKEGGGGGSLPLFEAKSL